LITYIEVDACDTTRPMPRRPTAVPIEYIDLMRCTGDLMRCTDDALYDALCGTFICSATRRPFSFHDPHLQSRVEAESGLRLTDGTSTVCTRVQNPMGKQTEGARADRRERTVRSTSTSFQPSTSVAVLYGYSIRSAHRDTLDVSITQPPADRGVPPSCSDPPRGRPARY
jgi:hypothetical protein